MNNCNLGVAGFFLAGFAWPTEVIPPVVQAASLLVPSTSAINGFTRLAQLGALLADVRTEFLTLCGLALFYGAVSWMLEFRRQRRDGQQQATPVFCGAS